MKRGTALVVGKLALAGCGGRNAREVAPAPSAIVMPPAARNGAGSRRQATAHAHG
jgi:hypothetical protein